MIDAFVAMEDDDRVAQTEDLFVPLQAPFVPGRYGEGLLREFIEKAARLHAGLEDPAAKAWQPPPVAPRAQDPLPFLQACQSFVEHYRLPGLLALYLTPADVPDVGVFRTWLDLVTRNALPKLPKLRFVLRDDRKSPALAPLAQAMPKLVVAIPADLDMPAARLEISENAGNLDKPGGQYRHQFVQMTNALGKPDLAAADQHAKAALDITAAQGWHALAIPIHLAMGAALAGAGKTEEANRRYVNAESSAVAGEQAGDPVCAKLRVQARMCRGGLLVHAGAWQMAAALYSRDSAAGQGRRRSGHDRRLPPAGLVLPGTGQADPARLAAGGRRPGLRPHPREEGSGDDHARVPGLGPRTPVQARPVERLVEAHRAGAGRPARPGLAARRGATQGGGHMTIAAKHMDPLVGIDTHIIMIPSPAGPIPTPLPHPYVGMVFDPLDYVPVLGASVYINGLPRGVAGSNGKALPPHIPMGGPFMKPPTNESELFMGSATVVVDGDPQAFLALPVLSCQDIGIVAPPRPKKKAVAKSLLLPTTVVLCVPMGPLVLIGGPPTIAMTGGVMSMLRGLQKMSKSMKKLSRFLRKKAKQLCKKRGLGPRAYNMMATAICTVTGHPVDVANGRVFTEQTDFEIGGPLPLVWERTWYSTSTYRGPLGHGWHHAFDVALHVTDELLLLRAADGRHLPLPLLDDGAEYFDRREKLTVRRVGSEYRVEDSEGLTQIFAGTGDLRPLARVEDALGNRIVLDHDTAGRLTGIVDSCGRQFSLVHDRGGLLQQIEGPHPDDPARRVVLARYEYDSVRQSHFLARCPRPDHALRVPRPPLGARGEPQRPLLLLRVRRQGRQRPLRPHLGRRRHLRPQAHLPAPRHHRRELARPQDDVPPPRRPGVEDRGCPRRGDGNRAQRMERDRQGDRCPGARHRERAGRARQLARRESPRRQRGQARATTPGIGQSPWRDQRAASGSGSTTTPAAWSSASMRWDRRRASAGQGRGSSASRTRPAPKPCSSTIRLAISTALRTPDGAETHWFYDGLGRCVRVQDPAGNLETRQFDLLGQAFRVHEPDGNVRELGYDGEGNVVRAKDKDYDVEFKYGGMNRLLARTQGGTTVRFAYDTEEDLTAIYNEAGAVYRFVLGPTGEVSEEFGFDGLLRKYERDQAGRVQKVLRPGGLCTEYAYDGAGRVTGLKHLDSQGQVLGEEKYEYRKDGELVSAANGTCAVKLERDILGRVVREVMGEDAVESEYGPLGLRTRMRTSRGHVLDIERNVVGDVLDPAGRRRARGRARQRGEAGGRACPGRPSSRATTWAWRWSATCPAACAASGSATSSVVP